MQIDLIRIILDWIVLMVHSAKHMFDDRKKITEICEYIDSVIISDRMLFSGRMVHLKNEIASSLAKNFKGTKSELDFLLRRL